MKSLAKLLQMLGAHQVEFIVVGGMAAVLHGAPVTTQDVDVVHRRTPENIERILTLLKMLNARYRGQPQGRILFPTASSLAGSGHHLLTTDLGPIDFLCELAVGQGYEELLPFADIMSDGTQSIQVVGLEKLIEIKTETGRAKDELILPILLKLFQQLDQ
jgi:hypothetical protein